MLQNTCQLNYKRITISAQFMYVMYERLKSTYSSYDIIRCGVNVNIARILKLSTFNPCHLETEWLSDQVVSLIDHSFSLVW